jgi:Flp pilus assembly protein TadG
MFSPLRKARSNEAGAELLEFAFVLPLFVGLILAIIWFGQAFNAYETITRAAREGARTALAPTCGSCTADPDPDSKVVDAVTAALQASHVDLDALQVYAPAVTSCGVASSCNTPAHNIRVCRNVKLNSSSPSSDPQQCGVLVSFGYATPFSFAMNTNVSSVLNLPAITLKTSVQMAQEQ